MLEMQETASCAARDHTQQPHHSDATPAAQRERQTARTTAKMKQIKMQKDKRRVRTFPSSSSSGIGISISPPSPSSSSSSSGGGGGGDLEEATATQQRRETTGTERLSACWGVARQWEQARSEASKRAASRHTQQSSTPRTEGNHAEKRGMSTGKGNEPDLGEPKGDAPLTDAREKGLLFGLHTSYARAMARTSTKAIRCKQCFAPKSTQIVTKRRFAAYGGGPHTEPRFAGAAPAP